MKPATAKPAKEVKAAKESKAFDFTAPPAVAKQASKPFNGVFTGGVTAKQPFVPKADPLPVYVNPVKSVFSTAVQKKQVSVSIYLLCLVLILWGCRPSPSSTLQPRCQRACPTPKSAPRWPFRP